VELKDHRAAVAVLHGETELVSLGCPTGEVEGGAVVLEMASVTWEFSAATPRAELDLAVVVEALRDELVRGELESSDIPAQHLWRKLGLDMPEQKRDADAAVSYTTIKRVPSCRL